jgi:hypothetical protein
MHNHLLIAEIISHTAAFLGFPVPADAAPEHPSLEAARASLEAYAPRDLHEADQAARAIALRSVFLNACRRALDPDLPTATALRLHRSIAALTRELSETVAALDRRQSGPVPAHTAMRNPMHQAPRVANHAVAAKAEGIDGYHPMHQPGPAPDLAGAAALATRPASRQPRRDIEAPWHDPMHQPAHQAPGTANRFIAAEAEGIDGHHPMHQPDPALDLADSAALATRPVSGQPQREIEAPWHDPMHQPAQVPASTIPSREPGRSPEPCHTTRQPQSDPGTPRWHDPIHQDPAEREQHYDTLARFASRRLPPDLSSQDAWARAAADANEASVEVRFIEAIPPRR